MKRSDFIIIAIAIVIIAGIYFVSTKISGDSPAGELAICVDGEVIETLPIYEDRTYEFEGQNGDKNLVEIRAGKVSIIEANCQNKICVHTPSITKAGESIVCLPHRFYVEILGEKEEGIDAVAD